MLWLIAYCQKYNRDFIRPNAIFPHLEKIPRKSKRGRKRGKMPLKCIMFWHHVDLREILCKICNSQKFVAEPSWLLTLLTLPLLQNNHSTPLQTIWENLPQILFPLKLKYCLYVLQMIISQLSSRFLIFFIWIFSTLVQFADAESKRLCSLVMFLGSSWVCLMSDEIDFDIFLWKYFTESKYCWLF